MEYHCLGMKLNAISRPTSVFRDNDSPLIRGILLQLQNKKKEKNNLKIKNSRFFFLIKTSRYK